MESGPIQCVLPPRRQWGWAAQLYSLRREDDAGIGDLASARDLAAWSADRGAAFLMLSPLHALAPGQDSPYFPTSRCARDINCLPADSIARPVGPLVDRPAARARKQATLAVEFGSATRDGDRDAFIEEQGDLLRGFAAFSVLADRFGWDFRVWPDALRTSPIVVADNVWATASDEAEFVCFTQWSIDKALEELAATGCPPVNDIAVGVDPGGFDAWWWQEGVMPGLSVGAPPDQINASGQDWGVAVFDPDWLGTVKDGPLDRAWEFAARHAVGLRIDHVMGLSRQFHVPYGASPLDGEYHRYPLEELLARLVSVSTRTGTWVVGEDLGTVEPGLRGRLADAAVLSTKVIRFEDDPPDCWPRLALGTASTHDLAPLSEGAEAAHRALADSPCLAVAATLEDTLKVTEPPNRPGIDHPHNWRQSLPLTVSRLLVDPGIAATAELMRVRSSG